MPSSKTQRLAIASDAPTRRRLNFATKNEAIMAKPPRASGSEPQLQVFQDDYFHPSTPHTAHPMSQTSRSRQPLQPTSHNAVLNPPTNSSAKQSPFKGNSRATGLHPRTPLKAKGASKLNMVQMLPPTSLPGVASTDSLTKKQPPMSRFKTGLQKPAPDFRVMQLGGKANSPLTQIYPAPPPNPMKDLGSSFHFMDNKENAHLTPRPPSQGLNITDETYLTKVGGKRQLLEAAPIKEQRPVKKPKLEESEVPAHDAFPPIEDDGEKPAISYANLIGMAILRSPQRKLTLSQIYKWISDTFRWYNLEDAGWQNSIRHNLSLNKAFIKQERPKNDPGKGHYWSIEPGKEQQFMGKEKATRKPVVSAENLPVMSTRLEPQPSLAQASAALSTPVLEPAQQFHQRRPSTHFQRPMSSGPNQDQQLPTCQMLPTLPTSTYPSSAEMPPQPSSDATILIPSDSATIEDLEDMQNKSRDNEHEGSNEVNSYSPLPAAMHSSPPIPRHVDLGHRATPPRPVSRHHGSSRTRTGSRSHKRRIASMDDSGYISSLESSAMRPHPAGKLLTSEADRPRIKRGRAEEEIARMRASSYDSPSKVRSYGFIPPSSSPIHHNTNDGLMLPPLTPAQKLKAPPKPPPSVSPGTNLLRHRQNVQNMIESPFRRASQLPRLDPAVQLTPGPKFDDFFYSINADIKGLSTPFTEEFDIFADPNTPSMCFPTGMSPMPSVHGNGSPVKRSVKRPRLERPHSTSSLGGLKNGSANSAFLRVPKQSPASKMMFDHQRFVQGSPSHYMAMPSSPLKLFMQASPSKMPSMDIENIQPGLNHGSSSTEDDGTDGTSCWLTMDDLCDTQGLLGEDLDDFNGIDILGGFEKIGSGSHPAQNQLQHGQRTGRTPFGTALTGKPGIGRSFSTNF